MFIFAPKVTRKKIFYFIKLLYNLDVNSGRYRSLFLTDIKKKRFIEQIFKKRENNLFGYVC